MMIHKVKCMLDSAEEFTLNLPKDASLLEFVNQKGSLFCYYTTDPLEPSTTSDRHFELLRLSDMVEPHSIMWNRVNIKGVAFVYEVFND